MDKEKRNITETAIDIETKSDILAKSEEKIDQIIVTKSDWPTQPHNGKGFFIIAQDNDYAVTHSKNDNSFRGWVVNLEENGQQQLDVYFKLDKTYKYGFEDFVLHKKVLLFRYRHNDEYQDVRPGIIDLSGDEGRFLQLKHQEKISIDKNSIGFLPNDDFILVSLRDYKIYLYSFINKPTDATLWDCSQIYDMKIHKSFNKQSIECFVCFVYQTKLFLFINGLLNQMDLMKMTIEMQYNMVDLVDVFNAMRIVINQNQTLLAFHCYNDGKTNIYSMETGIRISRYDENYEPVEFVTLKDGYEGLIVKEHHGTKYKFLDPFHPSDAIDITDVIMTNVTKIYNVIITKSNKKFHIDEDNVWVTDGLKEDTSKQMPNNTYYNNDLSSFKTIRSMLDDVIRNNITHCIVPEDNEIKLTDGELFHFTLHKYRDHLSDQCFEIKGFKKSQNNDDWKETVVERVRDIYSCKQLDNQDLALITKEGICIYTIVENSTNSKNYLKRRYYWDNIKRRYDYDDFKEILDNEFNGSLSSLPKHLMKLFEYYNAYQVKIKNIVNDPVEFSKSGLEILELAIKEKKNDIVQLIFDKIFELVEKDEDTAMMALLSIISLKLPELCDYSSLVMKYISRTSIWLDPSCTSINKNLTNTSLYAYSKDIYFEKSLPTSNNYVSYVKSLFSKEPEETQTIRFIVPFPQICKYQGNYNSWNEFLYIPKSVLFCNIDTNSFYQWWNFAAIVDFKWKTFGKIYYYFIWLFYTIFGLCFALASIITNSHHEMILFIITILLGLIHLSFEIRHCLLKQKVYLKDPWNLFDVGAYSLPIITSIYCLINGPSPQIISISIILLTFRFILFFRVFRSYGKYFSIIIGVAEEVFPFLVVLFFIILGFGFSFFILLKPTTDNSIPGFNDDKNNIWNLASTYNSIKSDGSIDTATTFIETPSSNTNLFRWFHTSILAMYLLLTGDSSSLSSWTYLENPIMTFLLFVFTFSTTIYLMNLFIGLLNMAIENYNKDEEFLLLKAQIIMEIELFYMLPYQRHKREWFPDWIYYDMPVEEVRNLIDAIDNKKTRFDSPPFISKKLRNLIGIPEPIELQQHIENKLKQSSDELKQQLIKDMQELLNNFIKNSIPNNDIKDKTADDKKKE